MKWITAYVRPHRLDDIRQALAFIGISGLTVIETLGAGTPGWVEVYRGAEYYRDVEPYLTVELMIDDGLCEQVIEAICNLARTGRPGDGKIVVRELSEIHRVRTGEQGSGVL
jgi:nitrogen regulatory protein P-II 2